MSDDDLSLLVAPVPNQAGIFFHGSSQGSLPFGDGFLCALGGVVRANVLIGSGNSVCTKFDNSSSRLDLTPYVNTRRYFQYWFRDPMGAGAGFNTSNAIGIDILP